MLTLFSDRLLATIQSKEMAFWRVFLKSTKTRQSDFPEYTPLFADTDDICQSDPCGSHGTCVVLSDSYHCICDIGYTGYNCHLSICEDNSSPCENNSTCSLCEAGVCNSTGLSFQCNCVDNFYGVLCTDRKLLRMLARDILSLNYVNRLRLYFSHLGDHLH